MTCINCEKGSPPFHDLSAEGEKPRLVCHGCWTLGGLLHDKQLKADALDIMSTLSKTKREGRKGRRRPRWEWKP